MSSRVSLEALAAPEISSSLKCDTITTWPPLHLNQWDNTGVGGGSWHSAQHSFSLAAEDTQHLETKKKCPVFVSVMRAVLFANDAMKRILLNRDRRTAKYAINW
jgi:hypothetical protein